MRFLLFSGDYEAVIARTAHRTEPSKASALIGALALSGRLDEAQSAFRKLEAAHAGEEVVTEARFFVIAGLCHAGSAGKALRLVRRGLVDLRGPSEQTRFWIWQGLALVRFFEGRFQRSRPAARRALATAVQSAFPYARVLALDLLAHVLLHTGELFAGMRLLSQAAALAESLGYEQNTLTLRTAATIAQLKFLLTDAPTAIAEAEAALDAPAVSYFARRNGLVELASALALCGDGGRAQEVLEQARRISLPGSDRRGKTRWLIAHGLVTALSRGPAEARASLDDAREHAGDQLTLQAEVGFVEWALLGAADAERQSLPALARATGIARARFAAAMATGTDLPNAAQIEDGLGRLLLDCRGQDGPNRVRRVVDAGLLGLVPWALGLDPGRRIILTPQEVLTENQGTVMARPLPGGPSLRLLEALRAGDQSRETLVSSVWGLGRYNPTKHNAVIKTAVSRLRPALGEPAWVVTRADGYGLAAGVEVLSLEPGASDDLAPSPGPSKTPGRASESGRILSLLRQEGAVRASEIARSLGVSPSSALRMLRRMVEEGSVARVGAGRATRYQLVDGAAAAKGRLPSRS